MVRTTFFIALLIIVFLPNYKEAVCPEECKICHGDAGCSKCMDEYYLSGTQCLKCSNGCKVCTSSTKSTTCNSGYFPSGNYCCQYECKSCSGSNCNICKDGYYLTYL